MPSNRSLSHFLRLLIGATLGLVLRWVLQADGLEGGVIVALPVLAAWVGNPVEKAGLVFGAALSAVVIVVSTVTTIFNSTAGPILISASFLVGGVFGLKAASSHSQNSETSRRDSADFVPALLGLSALLLLGTRLWNLSDMGSRWWVLAHASEDNAAWLNMLGRAGKRGAIGVADIENLGHSIPSFMWIFRQLGDFLPGASLLSPKLSDASQMAIGVLLLEALLVAASVYLASATVVSAQHRLGNSRSFIVNFLLAAPASVGALLGGLLLARFGYLSALSALVGAQIVILILLRKSAEERSIWLALAGVFTGLSWFPIIPIVAIGLIWEMARLFRSRKTQSRFWLAKCAFLAIAAVNILLHLQQILRRYPNVDRLQGSIWIGSQTLVTFFVLLSLTATIVSWKFLPLRVVGDLVIAVAITNGWLALVWFNDLLRTGGPAHYGTTKLTFIVMFLLLPLLLGLISAVIIRQSGSSPHWLAALAISAAACLGVTSLSNDLNNVWPRNPSEGERAQDAVAGILSLIEEAASLGPKSVICLFVGDFEATGKWAGSYNCTRWGSSLAGVDGPNNEGFRQTILGNGVPDETIGLLARRGFFNGVAIVTDNPERLAQINPWGIVSTSRESGGKYVVFRPDPTSFDISSLTP